MKRTSLKQVLLTMCILPTLLVTVILTTFAIVKLRSSMVEETLNTLKTASYVTEEVYNTMSGEWTETDGVVYKGDALISDNFDTLDAIKRDTGCDVTIFYGDTRVATTILDSATGERLTGTTCTDEVRKAVLSGKDTYSSTDTVINGENIIPIMCRFLKMARLSAWYLPGSPLRLYKRISGMF